MTFLPKNEITSQSCRQLPTSVQWRTEISHKRLLCEIFSSFQTLHICMTECTWKMTLLILFQWLAVAEDLVLGIIIGTGSKHPQRQMALIVWDFNAWLTPRNNRTAQPVNLTWVNHSRVAHLLCFASIDTHTHTSLFLIALNDTAPPDNPCYAHKLQNSICVNCEHLIWDV